MTITTLITHAGTFHADDVFATAFLEIFIEHVAPDTVINVQRVRSIENIDTSNTIIYDIGLGEFDHHQENSPVRDNNGIPYAAFGLLWKYYAPKMFDPDFVEEFDKSFVSAIDAQDNGVVSNPLSLTISTMNPLWDSNENPDDCFMDAVDFAKNVLLSHFNRYFSKKRAEDIVKHAVDDMENGVLIFDKFVPFESYIMQNVPDAMFAVFPSNREGWTLNTIRKSDNTFETRLPLPGDWLTGNAPEGMLFCHKALFISTFDTKEHAINAACEAMKKEG